MPVETTTHKRPVKYREVKRALQQEIAAGLWRVGDRLPAEYDLAKRFNVSYLTMRQALAGLVEEGALRRVQGKGTFILDPAPRELPSGTLHPMAILFPTNWQRRDPYYFPELLDGFQTTMRDSQCRSSLLNDNVTDDPKALAPGSAVACVLIEPIHLQVVERLRDAGHRVLGINRYAGQRSIPSVRMDDARGIGLAVDLLVSLGHRRISFLRGPADNFDAVDRLAGFRSAVDKHGLTVTMEAGDDFGEDSGYAAARMLMGLPNRPTALICASDLAAIGAVRAADEMGISVPADLSVVGFGDFSMARYVRPSLTTIRQCRTTLGRRAAEMLIRLANEEDVESVVLEAELIERESTTAAPASS